MKSLRLGSANVKNNPIMAAWKVTEDFKDVKVDCDIVGWQEISSKRNLLLLLSVLGIRWKTIFKGTATPISMRRKRFKILDRGKFTLHEGHHDASPIRRVVWVLVRDLETGLIFIFSNRHYVSGAWNDKEKAFKEWRKSAWRIGYFKDQEFAVTTFNDDLLHIGVGDMNKVVIPKFVPAQEWIWNKGIDKMFIIDPAHEVDGWERRKDRLNSDHASIQAVVHV